LIKSKIDLSALNTLFCTGCWRILCLPLFWGRGRNWQIRDDYSICPLDHLHLCTHTSEL